MNLLIDDKKLGQISYKIPEEKMVLLKGANEKIDFIIDCIFFALFGEQNSVQKQLSDFEIVFAMHEKSVKREKNTLDNMDNFFSPTANLIKLKENFFTSQEELNKTFLSYLKFKTKSGNNYCKLITDIIKIKEKQHTIEDRLKYIINFLYSFKTPDEDYYAHKKRVECEIKDIVEKINNSPVELKNIKPQEGENEKDNWTTYSNAFVQKFSDFKSLLNRRDELETIYWQLHERGENFKSKLKEFRELNEENEKLNSVKDIFQNLLLMIEPEITIMYNNMVHTINENIKHFCALYNPYNITIQLAYENQNVMVVTNDKEQKDIINMVLNLAAAKYLNIPFLILQEKNLPFESNLYGIFDHIKNNFQDTMTLISHSKVEGYSFPCCRDFSNFV